MNQFLSNKIIAGIVALALLVGVGVLVSSGDTSSTTRNAALVVATPCIKPGQVTKVSKQSVVCATTNTGSLWYATMKAKGKAQACKSPGAIRKKSNIVWVCGVVKKKKLWQATQPLPPAVVASTAVIEPGASQPTPALDSTQVATPEAPVVADNAVLADTKIPDDKIVTKAIEDATPTVATTTPTVATTTPTTTTPTVAPTTPTVAPTTPTVAPTTPTVAPTTPTTANPCTTNNSNYCPNVGDAGPGGGIVFYVAPTAFACGLDLKPRCTILEAAPTDYEIDNSLDSVEWGCQGAPTGATATAIGTGEANTAKILAECNTAGIAADVANKYATRRWGDWFLPSRDELNELCKIFSNGRTDTTRYSAYQNGCTGNTAPTGGFAARYYWSSSENDAGSAWVQYFNYGYQFGANKDNGSTYVRPVRAF